jgi:hypothetical protein
MDFTGKTTAELRTLRENAERVLADPKRKAQHARASAMLEQIPEAAVAPRRSHEASRVATATTEAVARLATLAPTLLRDYDLSAPAGTRQPHGLTAADGTPKVGGRQRSREVAADRYISHKRGDRIAALGWLRRHEEEALGGGGWYVGANGQPATPALDYEAALAAFLAELAAIGAPRR